MARIKNVYRTSNTQATVPPIRTPDRSTLSIPAATAISTADRILLAHNATDTWVSPLECAPGLVVRELDEEGVQRLMSRIVNEKYNNELGRLPVVVEIPFEKRTGNYRYIVYDGNHRIEALHRLSKNGNLIPSQIKVKLCTEFKDESEGIAIALYGNELNSKNAVVETSLHARLFGYHKFFMSLSEDLQKVVFDDHGEYEWGRLRHVNITAGENDPNPLLEIMNQKGWAVASWRSLKEHLYIYNWIHEDNVDYIKNASILKDTNQRPVEKPKRGKPDTSMEDQKLLHPFPHKLLLGATHLQLKAKEQGFLLRRFVWAKTKRYDPEGDSYAKKADDLWRITQLALDELNSFINNVTEHRYGKNSLKKVEIQELPAEEQLLIKQLLEDCAFDDKLRTLPSISEKKQKRCRLSQFLQLCLRSEIVKEQKIGNYKASATERSNKRSNVSQTMQSRDPKKLHSEPVDSMKTGQERMEPFEELDTMLDSTTFPNLDDPFSTDIIQSPLFFSDEPLMIDLGKIVFNPEPPIENTDSLTVIDKDLEEKGILLQNCDWRIIVSSISEKYKGQVMLMLTEPPCMHSKTGEYVDRNPTASETIAFADMADELLHEDGTIVVLCDQYMYGHWADALQEQNFEVFSGLTVILNDSVMERRRAQCATRRHTIQVLIAHKKKTGWKRHLDDKARCIGSINSDYYPLDDIINNVPGPDPRFQLLDTNGKPVRSEERNVDLWMLLMYRYTDENDMICDPYCGTASAAIAAYQMQRRFIGFENDENCYKLSLARLRKFIIDCAMKPLCGEQCKYLRAGDLDEQNFVFEETIYRPPQLEFETNPVTTARKEATGLQLVIQKRFKKSKDLGVFTLTTIYQNRPIACMWGQFTYISDRDRPAHVVPTRCTVISGRELLRLCVIPSEHSAAYYIITEVKNAKKRANCYVEDCFFREGDANYTLLKIVSLRDIGPNEELILESFGQTPSMLEPDVLETEAHGSQLDSGRDTPDSTKEITQPGATEIKAEIDKNDEIPRDSSQNLSRIDNSFVGIPEELITVKSINDSVVAASTPKSNVREDPVNPKDSAEVVVLPAPRKKSHRIIKVSLRRQYLH